MAKTVCENCSDQRASQASGPRRDGRLCRIVNLANGALLDIETGNERNHIIGSPAATAAVKTWRITAMGPGYVIRTADDTIIPRYLAPALEGAGGTVGKRLSLSTFPVTWDLGKTEEFNTGGEEALPDVVEELTCTIRWPFYEKESRVLDLENGTGTKIHFHPLRLPQRLRCQHWRIQFLDEAPRYTPMSHASLPNTSNNPTGPPKIGLESGGVYIIYNIKSNTVIDQTLSSSPQIQYGYACHGKGNQRWEAIKKDNGWTFRNLDHRHYLSIDKDPKNDVVLAPKTSDDVLWEVQQHEFEFQRGADVFRLVLSGSIYSVTLSNYGSTKSGTPIVLRRSWNGLNQLWRFEKVG